MARSKFLCHIWLTSSSQKGSCRCVPRSENLQTVMQVQAELEKIRAKASSTTAPAPRQVRTIVSLYRPFKRLVEFLLGYARVLVLCDMICSATKTLSHHPRLLRTGLRREGPSAQLSHSSTNEKPSINPTLTDLKAEDPVPLAGACHVVRVDYSV
jgi:hypothetical protein